MTELSSICMNDAIATTSAVATGRVDEGDEANVVEVMLASRAVGDVRTAKSHDRGNKLAGRLRADLMLGRHDRLAPFALGTVHDLPD